MKQVIFDRFGAPSRVVKCIEVPAPPAPNAWEVTVKIMAAAVNPSDLSVLRGQYGTLPARLPASIGLEAAGTITAVGESVQGFGVGDRVIIVANDNWRQHRNVVASLVHRVPEGLDDLQAAMIKTNSLCAYKMLRGSDDLQAGDFVIQSAPLSAVGRMVIGMAKAMGLHTVNIVRRQEAIDEVLALGGDIAIVDGEDLGQRVSHATGDAPIMLGLDAVAGEMPARIADCLEVGATLVSYGMLSGEAITLRPDHTIFKDIRMRGFWLSKVLGRMPQTEREALFTECLEVMMKHGLRNEVGKTFRLDQVSEAIEFAEAADRRGKVILLPNGPVEGVGASDVSAISDAVGAAIGRGA